LLVFLRSGQVRDTYSIELIAKCTVAALGTTHKHDDVLYMQSSWPLAVCEAVLSAAGESPDRFERAP